MYNTHSFVQVYSLYSKNTIMFFFFYHPPYLHVLLVHMHIPYECDSRIKASYLLFSRNGFALVTLQKANTLKSMKIWYLLPFSPQGVLFYYLWLALNSVKTVFSWGRLLRLVRFFYSFTSFYSFLMFSFIHKSNAFKNDRTYCKYYMYNM